MSEAALPPDMQRALQRLGTGANATDTSGGDDDLANSWNEAVPLHTEKRTSPTLTQQQRIRRLRSLDWSETSTAPQRISRKQRKALRPRVADLKLHAPWPSVVEPWDCAAPEPVALVRIKGERFTVPVPSHWRSKRKYLENKRGLPSGTIAFVREAQQQLLQRFEPVDESMHSSSTPWRLWSRLRDHGDVYTALSEFDPLRGCSFRPGIISTALAEALNWSGPATCSIHECPWREGWRRTGRPSPPAYPAMEEASFRWSIQPGQAGCLARTMDSIVWQQRWGQMQNPSTESVSDTGALALVSQRSGDGPGPL